MTARASENDGRPRRVGLLLCGGKSSRMGRDKSWLPWRGTTLFGAVVEVLRGVTDHVVAVAAPGQRLPRVGGEVEIVTDREPGLGPLAGIREGLERHRDARVYVASVDSPYLSVDFVEAMFAAAEGSPSGTAAPVDGNFVQPMHAVYDGALADAAADLLAAERRRPLFLLEAGNYVAVPIASHPAGRVFENLNTPATYLQAIRNERDARPVTIEWTGTTRRWADDRETSELPVGLLGELWQTLDATVIGEAGDWWRRCLWSLEGRDFVDDPGIPIGPGERLIAMDAAVGG